MSQITTNKAITGFNLFAYMYGDDVYALGGVRHDQKLSERDLYLLLNAAVPYDAITAYRQGFKAAEYTTELPDGTVALPGRIFKELQRTGRVMELFDGIFRRLGALQNPVVYCFTLVRDGVPVNKDGPIYCGDNEEFDTQFRHRVFIRQNGVVLGHIARTKYQEHGRGAVVAVSDPQPSDPEYREVRFLPLEKCHLGERVWTDVRREVNDYNPDAEMVVVFLGPKTDKVYRVAIPEAEDSAF